MKLHRWLSSKERFWKRVKKTRYCWIWIGAKNNKGYGQIMVNKRLIAAHRYSYFLQKGSIPKDNHILHKCDNPSCVNPQHLWVGTNNDNVQDRVNKGREADRKGEKNPNAKITYEIATKIRKMYKTRNYKVYILGQMFGVNRNVIGRIIGGKQW